MRSFDFRSHRSRLARDFLSLLLASIVLVAVGLVVYSITRQTEALSPARPLSTATTDLGITYLPLTRGVAAYYDIGVESGALVTEVAPNSLADKAGVKVGDVIVSYNGVLVNQGNPLLAELRKCPAGKDVVIEVWRYKATRTLSIIHNPN